jgi:hypothetical protein
MAEERRRNYREELQSLSEEQAKRVIDLLERSKPVQMIRASQFSIIVFGLAGISWLMHSLERFNEMIPYVSSPLGEFLTSVAFLGIAGIGIKNVLGFHLTDRPREQ